MSANDLRQNLAGATGSRELPTPGGIDCIFISCFKYDFEFLQCLLSYTGTRLHRAETLNEADFLLTVTGARYSSPTLFFSMDRG